MRLLGWILVGLVVIRVGAWVLAGAGHVSAVAAGVLADAVMDAVVFAAWTVAALAGLWLLAALAHGAAELHDRRNLKRRAARPVRPVAASPRPAPEEAAPATSPMPAAGDPVVDPLTEPVLEQPVLGPVEHLTKIGELLGNRDPGGSGRDAGPVIGAVPPTLPYDEFGPGRSGDEDHWLPVTKVRSATPPSPVSEDAPIINRRHVPMAVSAPQNPPTPPPSIPRTPQVLPAPPAPPVPALLVLACRGVQIGDENQQFNTYTYKLHEPTVDFAKVLGRPAVRDALSRLIMDPENDELRAKAAEALCAGKWTLKEKELLDLGPLGRRSPHSDVTRDLKAMQGFITVRNCQGVQAGNRCYQRNDFVYVCPRATVNASSLLKAHPEVASSLIDAVVTPSQKEWKEPGEKLNAAVRAALNSPESLDAIPDRSINVSPRSSGVLRDHDGVSIGNRCRTAAFKAVMVELRKPSNLPECVVKESRRLWAAQLRRQVSPRREPPSSPSVPPAPSEPSGPSRPSEPSANASRPSVPNEPRPSATSAPDPDRLPPPHRPRSPNRGPEPPSGPESPSSGRGFGL
ncbi:RIP homotypic interaction motif-containing protein [Streptomyces sp. NPDC048291]|uniref:RIP homotypic interaction motif-containing protein n=1 Tax=Streptomyces sp. NPDC048291 TaxID=3365530 RepID=UPI003719A742